MALQPIELWGHWGSPNPWKVCIILDELKLEYKTNYVELGDTKNPEYVKVNPNGRLPAIRDPNTGTTLWESGAIILYLIEQYDKDNKISYPDFHQKYQAIQWLIFQVSGQGPYFGQAAWFSRFHPEKLPSAIDRYMNEIERVISVLDASVFQTGWLVGDKCTYADLSFVTWAGNADGLLKERGRLECLEKFPAYQKWLEVMHERETVRNVSERIRAGRAAHGLP